MTLGFLRSLGSFASLSGAWRLRLGGVARLNGGILRVFQLREGSNAVSMSTNRGGEMAVD